MNLCARFMMETPLLIYSDPDVSRRCRALKAAPHQRAIAPPESGGIRLAFEAADLMKPSPPFEANLLGLTHRQAIGRLERASRERLTDDGVHMAADPRMVDLGGVLEKRPLGEADGPARQQKRVRPFGGARAGDIPPSGPIRRGLLKQAQTPEGFPEERVIELTRHLKARAEDPCLRPRDPQGDLAHKARGRRSAHGTSVRPQRFPVQSGKRFGPDGPTG